MGVEDVDLQVGEMTGADAAAGLRGLPRWSIARLIAIVDEAIDAAGEQLVQSGGLTVWSDDFAPTRQVGTKVGPSPRDLSIYEESEPASGPGAL